MFSALVAVHTAYCALQIVRLTLHYVTEKVLCADHERRSKLVAKHSVDERIDCTVSEADEVRRQHCKEEVLLLHKADLLHLRDERDQVER